ncbi:hypothetical protein [Brazilian marseillevirus]|uniref:hypothetical protein n=1 Tax=Brazilian marseillevirus TaxID=1813599 RepID=UPI00078216E2|nr:hypothetical protein A3303_gp318 [Brazilian marseillevirus]AMQ10826.1 hypothetical protein [Brazilian marseillevirus]
MNKFLGYHTAQMFLFFLCLKDEKVQLSGGWCLRTLEIFGEIFLFCLFIGISIHPNTFHFSLSLSNLLLSSIGGVNGKLVTDGADKIGSQGSESSVNHRAKFDKTSFNASGSRRAHRESGGNIVLHRNNHAVLSGKSGTGGNPERREVTIDTSGRSGCWKSGTDQMNVDRGGITHTRPVALFGLRVESDGRGRRGDGVGSRGETRKESASGDGWDRSVY